MRVRGPRFRDGDCQPLLRGHGCCGGLCRGAPRCACRVRLSLYLCLSVECFHRSNTLVVLLPPSSFCPSPFPPSISHTPCLIIASLISRACIAERASHRPGSSSRLPPPASHCMRASRVPTPVSRTRTPSSCCVRSKVRTRAWGMRTGRRSPTGRSVLRSLITCVRCLLGDWMSKCGGRLASEGI